MTVDGSSGKADVAGTVLRAGLVFAWLAFVSSVTFRPERGAFNPWLDAGVYNASFFLAAAACARRAHNEPAASTPWRVLAAGLVIFATGNLYSSLALIDQEVYPSLADAMWLTFYVLVYCTIVIVIRASTDQFHVSTWLDGVVIGFGCAALVAAFVLDPVLAETQGRFAVVATNLAYPVADLLLVTGLVAWSVVHRRSAPAIVWLVLGLIVFGVGDVAFLYQSANDSYAEGGWLDVTWPLGAVSIGLASSTRSSIVESHEAHRPAFIIPGAFTASAVALLVYGQWHHLPVVTVGLAIATLTVAAIRTAWTVREVRHLSSSRQEARTDHLTGLPNRRAFLERLDELIAGARACAVVIADLDEFKKVNDDHGHDVGDELLRHVGGLLRIAAPNDLVARLGGDEFGVLIELDEPVDALDRVQIIADRICSRAELRSCEVDLRASFGVATHPAAAVTRRELLRAADVAMYRAKRAGSRVKIHDPSHPTSSDELRRLVEGSVEVAVQPVIDLATGNIESFEALARLRLEDGRVLQPAEFLDDVELASLESVLTARMLEESAAFHALIANDHPQVALRVNIFASDLANPGFHPHIVDVLNHSRLDPHTLILEISETSLAENSPIVARTVDSLRELGIRISVDDFGAGHSSLPRLLSLNVDELKLDGRLARGITTDPRTQALVAAAVEFGRALGLRVVAEGVETSDQTDEFRRLGCRAVQGFDLAHPVAPADASGLLRCWNSGGPQASALDDHTPRAPTTRAPVDA